jgi:hypothetical protein
MIIIDRLAGRQGLGKRQLKDRLPLLAKRFEQGLYVG